MKAWVVDQYGPCRDVLRLSRDVPEPPVPEGAGTLVRVLAAGVNFSDTLAIAGTYQIRRVPPFVPGGEVAGEVIEAGPASRFAPGDRIVAYGASGSFAEYTVVPDDLAFAVPPDVDLVDAAAMLVTYQTSHIALLHRARTQAHETVLVHSGAGGVGTAAIQIAHRLGARVVATAGSPEKLGVCTDCGADEVLNYRETDFVEAVRNLTNGRGADVIYDPVGGDTFDRSTKCIAWEGRLLVIGFASGRIPEIAANRIMVKNISIIGLNWPNYALHDRALLDAVQQDIWDGYRDGSLRPVIYERVPLSRVPDALDLLLSRDSYGKIVVVPDD